jgi:cytochrome c5
MTNFRNLKKYTFKPAIFLAFAFAVTLATISCTPKVQAEAENKFSAEYLAQGKTVFENSCARCHDLPSPSEHSAEAWTGILAEMAPKAKLNATQHEMVYNYIISAKN